MNLKKDKMYLCKLCTSEVRDLVISKNDEAKKLLVCESCLEDLKSSLGGSQPYAKMEFQLKITLRNLRFNLQKVTSKEDISMMIDIIEEKMVQIEKNILSSGSAPPQLLEIIAEYQSLIKLYR